MKYCIVPGCRSTSTKYPNKKFLSLPKNLKKRNAWLRAIRRPDLSPSGNFTVCEDHFNLEEDHVNYIRFKYYCGRNIYLKPDVVPHIFDSQLAKSAVHAKPCINNLKKLRYAVINDFVSSSEFPANLPSSPEKVMLLHPRLQSQEKDKTESIYLKSKEVIFDKQDSDILPFYPEEIYIATNEVTLDDEDKKNILPSCQDEIKSEDIYIKTEDNPEYLDGQDANDSPFSDDIKSEDIHIKTEDNHEYHDGQDANDSSFLDEIKSKDIYIKTEDNHEYLDGQDVNVSPFSDEIKSEDIYIKTEDNHEYLDGPDINVSSFSGLFTSDSAIPCLPSVSGNKKQTKDKQFSCCYCPFSAVKQSLIRHIMSKHTKEKPLSCSFCDYRTVQPGNLKSHIMSKHTKEKPHSCSYCDYRSVQSANLKSHIMTKHTKEKPHSCPYCAFSTGIKHSLKRHIMSKHKEEKPLFCSYCDYCTVNSTSLKRHSMAKHT